MKPWDAKDKALLQVRHTTRLRYAEPVVESHSEVRKTPVDTGLQRVLTHKLELEPAASLTVHRDYFGTHVTHFNLLEPHRQLEIRAEAVVETTDAVCCGPSAGDGLRPWPQRFAEYLHGSPSVPPLDEYQEIEHWVRPDLEPEDFLDALAEVGATFKRRFRYDPDATDVQGHPGLDGLRVAGDRSSRVLIGEPLDFQVEIEGGSPPYRFEVEEHGPLPPGVQFDSGSLRVFGTPTGPSPGRFGRRRIPLRVL